MGLAALLRGMGQAAVPVPGIWIDRAEKGNKFEVDEKPGCSAVGHVREGPGLRSSHVRKSARANARHPMQAAGVGCARDVWAWGRTEWLHSLLHWTMRLCKAGLSVIE